MNIKPLNLFLDATPRQLLFYFAEPTLLLSVVVAGLSFDLNNPFYFISGTAILILWFVLIFAGVLPQKDIALTNRMNQLKRGALIIFFSLFILGVVEILAICFMVPHLIQNQNISGNLKQLLPDTVDAYRYNDASALSQQAVENLLKGQNPYSHANIIQALLTYKGSYSRVTPLQVGIFSDVFPVPKDSQLQQVWDQAVQTPSQLPPELESNVCYPAGSFLLPLPFIYLGITDIRIVYAIFFVAGLAYTIWIIPKNKRQIFIGVALISLQ